MPPIKKMFVYLQPIYVRGRPRGTPSFIKDKTMIDKLHILDVITSSLDGTDKYLVDLKITADNRIYVSIDGDNGILIDDCVDLSRKIENSLNRDEEDFELNVASACFLLSVRLLLILPSYIQFHWLLQPLYRR